MKIIKPHFFFDKKQRNGALLLLLLVVLLQLLYVVIDFSSDPTSSIPSDVITKITRKIDSLAQKDLVAKQRTLKPFNPNYISDFKGYQLGMSMEALDRLFAYRKKGKYVNSVEDFQKVTLVSDSLLTAIAPYFKFPAWVQAKNKSKKSTKKTAYYTSEIQEVIFSIKDINQASVEDFTKILEGNLKLGTRIVKYRSKIQGFFYEDQLSEVWGIQSFEVSKILKVFKVVKKPTIAKININEATFKEVLKLPYIDYDLCKKIFEYRDEVAEIKDISELKNINKFPLKKYNRIVLYLGTK